MTDEVITIIVAVLLANAIDRLFAKFINWIIDKPKIREEK